LSGRRAAQASPRTNATRHQRSTLVKASLFYVTLSTGR
jgi:hypothetical protein